MFLIYDTETTGFPKRNDAPLTDFDNWPRMVQIAWQLHDEMGQLIEAKNFIIKPEGYDIPYGAEKIHGISTQKAINEGHDLQTVLNEFNEAVKRSAFVVGHNVQFDINIAGCEFLRKKINSALTQTPTIDTQIESTEYCALSGGKGGGFKWPKLNELHEKLFSEKFDEAHNATADVVATARSFFELLRLGVIQPQKIGFQAEFLNRFRKANPSVIKPIEIEIKTQADVKKTNQNNIELVINKNAKTLTNAPFAHLHCHTQFSVLQSTANIQALMKKAKEFNMQAIALTDLGNMYAAFNFVTYATQNGIKPIIGCEFFLTEDRKIQKFTKDNPDRRFNLVLLAKTKKGYHNLAKLCSIGFLEGMYAGFPRIDKEVLLQHKEDLICLTGGLDAEIPYHILNIGESQAEEVFTWYKETFAEDLYIELQRHGLEEENRVNDTLLKFSKKYNTKVIAANNTYYVEKEDANAHDILLCVKDGESQSTPIGRGRGYRFGFPNNQYYFKSQEEMRQIFADLPEAIENIQEIINKIEPISLEQKILLPKFPIPNGFSNENDYLKHLTFEGAKTKYPELTPEIEERLNFELKVIADMGFPGYFLIVQDFTSQARKMGVSVGPGRGSAAGSAVAYCIGITNIDPIKYKLLFERFLNPERVSMPDIDIDFDDEGRNKVIDWVIKKYGHTQVAQIITYGSMAAKSAIRDVARVMDLPLHQADYLAKLVPDFSQLSTIFSIDEKEISKKFKPEEIEGVKKLREIYKGDSPEAKILQQAKILEGSVRNTGTHACGVIITPDDMREHIPVSTAKDSELLVTQFDNKVIENAGMLKMDFLGLKTLSIIKDACKLIKEKHQIDINPDEIPLDDEKTFKLYQRAETNGTFQFESTGMQKHLKALKPNNIEDLIAMNALFRPGPMQYIENFINRKHGKEIVKYHHPLLEPILKDTNGIMVYQEQIMQVAQVLGGYTLGNADLLRRAMGKKKIDEMMKQRVSFKEGAFKIHQIDETTADIIFDDMMKFAEYGFNRSHSAAYSVVAFQTAYLKANFPAEYMASVLTHNMTDLKKVSGFMEECRHIGLMVLGPDVNESEFNFTINNKGQIRFGLGAIKGVGENAVESIIRNRLENGPYTSVFDFTKRIDLRAANKRTLESLAFAGAFDSFPGTHRAQFFFEESGSTFLEKAAKYGAKYQEGEQSAQVSLFGEASAVSIPEPPLPITPEWGTLEKLKKEREVVGIYISGHPLQDFELELNTFCNADLTFFANLEPYKDKELKFAGIVSSIQERQTKTGKPFGKFVLEDFHTSHEFALFGDDYVNFRKYLGQDFFLYCVGKVIVPKWKENAAPEIKFQKMELLSEIRDKMAKKLNLKVETQKIDKPLIDKLEKILTQSKGQCQVTLTFFDSDEKLKSEGIVKRNGVKLTNELLRNLKNTHEIEFELA